MIPFTTLIKLSNSDLAWNSAGLVVLRRTPPRRAVWQDHGEWRIRHSVRMRRRRSIAASQATKDARPISFVAEVIASLHLQPLRCDVGRFLQDSLLALAQDRVPLSQRFHQ